MASRFLSNININDEYTLPSADGSADQIIKTDGAGQLSFVDQSTINAGNAEHVVIYAKNTSGASISKGTPVYITGTVGATDTVEIAPADASNSAKMPAVGLLDDTLAVNDFGYVITGGFMDNITTDPIDGVTPSSNDTVYVKAGGGLTLTKPTGSNLIQNIAKVGKVSGGNSGSLIVSSILRTNDVPNLTTGKIWVGSPTYTTESTVVHLDETNTRMGIGTTSPNATLDVNGAGNFSGGTVVSGIDTQTVGVAVAKGTYIKSNDGNYLRNIIGHTSSGNIEIGQAGTSLVGDILLRPGAAGNIRFFGTGSEDMRITSSGNVGIGTTNPQEKLHVQNYTTGESHQAMFKGGAVTVGDYSYVSLNNGYSTEYNKEVRLAAVAELSTSNKTGFAILTSPDANGASGHERFRVTADGNVGIGTTSPTSKLHVDQDQDNTFNTAIAWTASANDALNITNNDTTDTDNYTSLYMRANGSSGNFSSRIVARNTNAGTGELHFQLRDNAHTANTETKLMIDSGGNVGIGTTSPSSKLQVFGDLTVGDDGLVGSWINVIAAGSGQDAGIRFGSESNTDSKAAIYTNTSNSDLHFDVTETTRILIDSATGNVGIGTTSPSQKLDVAGDATFDGRIYTNATALASVGILGKAIANGWAARYDSNNANYSGFYFDANNDASMILRDDAGNMNVYLRSDSTSYLNGGNVGIGTTNPSYKLDISGDLRVDNGNIGSTSGDELTHARIQGARHFLDFKEIRTANDTDWRNTTFKIQAGVDATKHQSIDFVSDNNYQEHIDIRTGNQAFNTRFTYDGKVGIGTNSPTQKLHVYNGTAYVTPISYAANQSAYALRIGAYNSTNFDMGLQAKSTSGGSPYMSFKTSSADDTLTIWGGSVGIGGIGIPSYTLDVDGQIRGEQYLRLADTGGTNRFSIRAESTYGTIDNGSNTLNYNANNHLFLVGLSEKMRINSSGNVGIGITSPGAKLDIFNTGGNAGSLADCQTYSALTVKPYSSVDSKLTFSANGVSTQLIQATNNASTTGRQISLQPFGGDVGVGVILPSEKLDVNGVVKSSHGYKGYVSHFHNCGFFHSPRSGDGANPIWIPINSTGTTSSDQYYNTWVPLYAGRVRKIILKHISGSTPTATVCTFRKKINGTLSGTTYAGTVTGGGAAGMKVTFDFGTTNFTFNAEDEVQIGIVTGVATQPGMGGVSCQIWYEYNIT